MCTPYTASVYSVRMSTVKHRVLDAAKTLYAESGTAGLSMRKVAKLAGVSTMASYRHFANREHLLHHLQVHAYEIYTALIEPQLAIDDPWEAVRYGAEAYLKFALEDTAWFKIAFMATEEFKGLRGLTKDGEALIEGSFRIPMTVFGRAVGDENASSEVIRGWAHMHGLIALHLADRLRFFLPSEEDFVRHFRREMEHYLAELRKRYPSPEKAMAAR